MEYRERLGWVPPILSISIILLLLSRWMEYTEKVGCPLNYPFPLYFYYYLDGWNTGEGYVLYRLSISIILLFLSRWMEYKGRLDALQTIHIHYISIIIQMDGIQGKVGCPLDYPYPFQKGTKCCKDSIYKILIQISFFSQSLKFFATNSDFLVSISLQPNVVDL